LNRYERFRPYGVSVSDLTGQLWCEKELDLGLTTDIEREVTEEMEAGKDKHRELEEELGELVWIKPNSFEDSVFLDLFQIHMDILNLEKTGVVRETPVFGELNDLFIKGVVDEIQIKDGVLEIYENKTRKKPTVPTQPQIRCNKFQAMLYWKLLYDMIDGKFGYTKLFDFYQLSPEKVTSEFQNRLKENTQIEIPTNDIKELGKLVFKECNNLKTLSDTIRIRYIHQGSDELIDIKEFSFNTKEFKNNLDFVSEYWKGLREPKPVGRENEWKCRYCDYSKICPKQKNK